MKFPNTVHSLPVRPHLDHLKKQAKDLLATLPSDAQLSDAQQQLAQSYGFSSWAQLKKAALERQPLTRALRELAAGKMCILFDERERENEGDFVVAAEAVTAKQINFMAQYGRGAICVALSAATADALSIAPQAKSAPAAAGAGTGADSEPSHGYDDSANWGPSIDLAGGSTGISASDRAETIRALLAESASLAQFRTPGHVPTLIAASGGLATRRGHTEGSVELMNRAGLKGAAVICEILNPDGTMARFDDLTSVAQQHDIALVTTADLLA